MVRMEVGMERWEEEEEDTPWPQEEDNKYGVEYLIYKPHLICWSFKGFFFLFGEQNLLL